MPRVGPAHCGVLGSVYSFSGLKKQPRRTRTAFRILNSVSRVVFGSLESRPPSVFLYVIPIELHGRPLNLQTLSDRLSQEVHRRSTDTRADQFQKLQCSTALGPTPLNTNPRRSVSIKSLLGVGNLVCVGFFELRTSV